MTTIIIPLTDALKSFVHEQVRLRGYRTSNEYVLDLIRKEQDRHHLHDLLLAGANSNATQPITTAYFDGLRKCIAEP